MTLIGILKFDEGIKLEYSDPNWNIWGRRRFLEYHPYHNVQNRTQYMYVDLSQILTLLHVWNV